MTTKSHIKNKKGNEETWEWNESKEVVKALKEYWELHEKLKTP